MAEDRELEQRFEDTISGLQKVKDGFGIDVFLYQGFYHRYFVLKGLMCMQRHFKAQSSDILIASFPKTGTTWLKALVFAIVNRSNYKEKTHPLLTKVPHDCIRTLDVDIYHNGEPNILIDNIPSPRLFHTHIAYTSLPKSVIDSACKIIYIYRDSKDVFNSFYHFSSKVISEMKDYTKNEKEATQNFTLTNVYESFCKGIYAYGPYWDHVLSYWKAAKEQSQNILFLKYEDLKRDPHFHVKKMAEFMGQPFTLEEGGGGMIQQIVDMCSFEFLSNLQVNKTGKYMLGFGNNAFYRKAEDEDWKKHLTLDMAKRLDQITKQKFDDHGLAFNQS